jgi:predicted RND superfamily exporter protein
MNGAPKNKLPRGGSFDNAYLRVRGIAAAHSRLVGVGTCLLLLLAFIGLPRLELDLSFQPLFAQGDATAAATAEFEVAFGQASGALVIVIVENRDRRPAEFLDVTRRIASELDGVPGISGVTSLPTLRWLEWAEGGPRFERVLPPALFSPLSSERLAKAFDELRRKPGFRGRLVNDAGTRLLVAARLEPPLAALDQRRAVLDDIRAVLDANDVPGIDTRITGVTPVELEYEQRVLEGQLVATAAACVALTLLLWLAFGRISAVIICVTPVSIAVVVLLGIMGWIGQPVTVINTALPVVVLVIGIADAVHMHSAWCRARQRASMHRAIDEMFRLTGRACFFTTLTTTAGFLSLLVAELDAVAAFGSCAAIGVVLAWLLNQLLVPWITPRLASGLPVAGRTMLARMADGTVESAIRLATTRPGIIVAASAGAALVLAIALPKLDIEQRFNEELSADDPTRVAQDIIDREFGGFLGPGISLRDKSGRSLLEPDRVDALDKFATGLRQLPDVSEVMTVLDVLPDDDTTASTTVDRIRQMRSNPETAGLASEYISADESWMSIAVRTGDIGTNRAMRLHEAIMKSAEFSELPGVDLQIVGQWWLAQRGMQQLLEDMVASLLVAALFVLPMLWLTVRDARLFAAGILANLFAILLPLGFMALCSISLRIGTAVVIAVALGIAVDSTMHIAGRFAMRPGTAIPPDTGRAVVFATLALVAGFASMQLTDILVIREMGLVACITFIGAAFADLVLLPAAYVLMSRSREALPVLR